MNLEEIIHTRRTIRKYKDKEVSQGEILDLINGAVQAPSASNAQSWRFLVVRDREIFEELYQAVLKAQEKIEKELPPGGKKSFASYGRYFVRFIDAPVLIVPIYKTLQVLSAYFRHPSEEVDREALEFMEEQSAVVSISLAVQNLLLCAHERGLGASCMTGPFIAREKIRQILSVPRRWEMAVFVALGYPDESPEPRGRKGAEDVIKWL